MFSGPRTWVQIALQALQFGPHVGGVLVSQLAILLQSLVNDVLQSQWQMRVKPEGGSGSCSTIAWEISVALFPENGSLPVAISYKTTPTSN